MALPTPDIADEKPFMQPSTYFFRLPFFFLPSAAS